MINGRLGGDVHKMSKHINTDDRSSEILQMEPILAMGLLNSLVCFGDFLEKSFCQYFGKEFSFLMLESSKLPGGSYCGSPYFLDVLVRQSPDGRRQSPRLSFLRWTLSFPSLSSQSSVESSSWWYGWCDEGNEGGSKDSIGGGLRGSIGGTWTP